MSNNTAQCLASLNRLHLIFGTRVTNYQAPSQFLIEGRGLLIWTERAEFL
jgi:hypothetical protein